MTKFTLETIHTMEACLDFLKSELEKEVPNKILVKQVAKSLEKLAKGLATTGG